ncbi:PPE family protein [Mycobacterium avium]
MYAGAGSGPFLTAAHAWDAISAQLAESAAGFRSTVLGLAASWRGPSADAMTASALAYAAWLTTTAAQAEHTANAARAAAAAYESARAATVPPALVATNRAQLRVLVATNLLGQNTAAIAALEAVYTEYWAQDIAAMAEYQVASAASTRGLQPFDSAPRVTDSLDVPDAQDATGGSGSILSLLNPNNIPLFGLDNGSLLGQYLQSFLSSGPYDVPFAVLGLFSSLWAMSAPGTAVANALNRLSAEATGEVAAPAVAVSSVRAAFGNAARVGPLSAPQQWWTQPPDNTVPAAPAAARPLPATETPTPLPLPAPIPARGGTPPKQPRPEPEYGGLVRFVTRPPAGG